MKKENNENQYIENFELEPPVDDSWIVLQDWSLPDDLDRVVPDDEVDYQEGLDTYQKERQQQKLRERSDLHDMRKDHAQRLFNLISVWLAFLALVLVLQGGLLINFKPELYFYLSDTVLIALITSTTATVLGLYIVAAYWLFGKRDRKDKKESDKK